MHPTWKYYQRNAGKIKIPPVKIFKNSARKTKFFAGEKKVKYRIISCEKVKILHKTEKDLYANF